MFSISKNVKDDITYEVILIDNASKISNEAAFTSIIPKIKYIRSDINLGFGLANNKGMEMAKGDFLLLLNSDTLVFDDSIQQCLSFLNRTSNARVGLLGCRLLNEDGSYQASFYPFTRNNFRNYFLSNNPLLNKLFSRSSWFAQPSVPTLVGDVSGAFMLLRRKVYEITKGFDPDFFLYYEETEWCRNRISKQFDIVYFPEASIVHLGGKSAPVSLMYIQAQLSLALYWYKTSLLSYILYILSNYANCIFFILQYYFTDTSGKANIKKYLNGFYRIQRYLYFNIPMAGRSYHSRREPLILQEAKPIFFP